MNKWSSEFAGGVVIRTIFAILLSSGFCGCGSHTLLITPDCVNATTEAFLYCPAAAATRIVDGNRTVEMLHETSGVGAVVTRVLTP